MNYVLDTNIITVLMKDDGRIKKKLQAVAFYGSEVSINGISYYEIKRGLLAANAAKKLKIFDEICKKLKIMLLDSRYIFDKASEIYAALKERGELVPDADILIAAMTLTQNFVLVSGDTDFQRIEGLTLENWLIEEL